MNASHYRPFAVMLILATGVLTGLVFWIVTTEPDLSAKMILILALTAPLLVVSVARSLKQAREVRAGVPLDDEMTRQRRLLAGARAFHLSFYLWLAIFLFNSKFTDREEMLGVGILGSAALFGLCWLHLKYRGHACANQD